MSADAEKDWKRLITLVLMWALVRPESRDSSARQHQGDVSYFLGGSLGLRKDREREKWGPNVEVINATIKFTRATSRLHSSDVDIDQIDPPPAPLPLPPNLAVTANRVELSCCGSPLFPEFKKPFVDVAAALTIDSKNYNLELGLYLPGKLYEIGEWVQ